MRRQVPQDEWGGYPGGEKDDEIPCRRMRSSSYVKAMGDEESGESDSSPKTSPQKLVRPDALVKVINRPREMLDSINRPREMLDSQRYITCNSCRVKVYFCLHDATHVFTLLQLFDLIIDIFFFSFAVFIPSASASCSIHILGWNLINYLFIYLFTNYLRSHYQLNAISVCLMCEPNEPPKWPACAKEETMDEWIWIEYKRIEQKAIELNWAICICQNIHEIWFLHLIDHSSGHSKHNNCVTSQEQVVARRVVRVICVLLKGTAAVNPEG